jgi:hypothetical protein
VMLVCGPPGCGESTYVANNAGPSDTVIDLDEIKAKLSGLPIYQADYSWLDPALAERNRQLAALAEAPANHTAWVIVSAPSDKLRGWWRKKLGAKVVVLLALPAVDCERRIRADERRRPVLHSHLAEVADWWAKERGRKMIPGVGGCNALGLPTDGLHHWNS